MLSSGKLDLVAGSTDLGKTVPVSSVESSASSIPARSLTVVSGNSVVILSLPEGQNFSGWPADWFTRTLGRPGMSIFSDTPAPMVLGTLTGVGFGDAMGTIAARVMQQLGQRLVGGLHLDIMNALPETYIRYAQYAKMATEALDRADRAIGRRWAPNFRAMIQDAYRQLLPGSNERTLRHFHQLLCEELKMQDLDICRGDSGFSLFPTAAVGAGGAMAMRGMSVLRARPPEPGLETSYGGEAVVLLAAVATAAAVSTLGALTLFGEAAKDTGAAGAAWVLEGAAAAAATAITLKRSDQ